MKQAQTLLEILLSLLRLLVEVDAGSDFRQHDREDEGHAHAAERDVVEAAVVDDVEAGQQLRGQPRSELAEQDGCARVAGDPLVVLIRYLSISTSYETIIISLLCSATTSHDPAVNNRICLILDNQLTKQRLSKTFHRCQELNQV